MAILQSMVNIILEKRRDVGQVGCVGLWIMQFFTGDG